MMAPLCQHGEIVKGPKHVRKSWLGGGFLEALSGLLLYYLGRHPEYGRLGDLPDKKATGPISIRKTFEALPTDLKARGARCKRPIDAVLGGVCLQRLVAAKVTNTSVPPSCQ
jgi:hypothetical protein